MRRPTPILLAGLILLTGCAAPRATGRGEIAGLKGAPTLAYASQADGRDASFAKAVQDRALDRLGVAQGAGKPRFLLQVGVAEAPRRVGVSSAAGGLDPAAWLSQPGKAPWWRVWNKAEAARIVTLAVIDAHDGKTVAWASVRAGDEPPARVADLLVEALERPTKG